jgi:hypothetical protein
LVSGSNGLRSLSEGPAKAFELEYPSSAEPSANTVEQTSQRVDMITAECCAVLCCAVAADDAHGSVCEQFSN